MSEFCPDFYNPRAFFNAAILYFDPTIVQTESHSVRSTETNFTITAVGVFLVMGERNLRRSVSVSG